MPQIRRHTIIFTLVTLFTDGLALFASMLLAYWLSFHSPLTTLFPIFRGIPPVSEYLEAFPVIVLVFWIVFKALNLYRRKVYYSSSWHFFTIVKAVTVAVFTLMAVTFLYREGFTYSRRLVAWAWFFSIILITLFRRVVDKLELWSWKQNKEPRKVMLLGAGPIARRLYLNFAANPRWGARVTSVLWHGEPPSPGDFPGTPIPGEIDEFEKILARYPVDEVILTRLDLPHNRIIEIILACEKKLVEVKLVPDMFSIMTSQVGIVNLDGVPVLGLRALPLHSAWNRFVKRTFDLVGGVIGLILTLPILLVCAVAVKLTSKGPVFFEQERMGENGKTFSLYKLRTMPVDAEKDTGPVLPKRDDRRATPLGRVLRRLSLDELPQLWNVIKGDMSLVGPRPERPVFVEKFKEDIPRYMSRHLVKSGVTGWAQANGLRGDTSIKIRVEYDMFYLENWSLFFDIKIILLTLFSRRVHQLTHRILPLE